MLPGYLHIDASRGLTAPLLNAAMADLLGDDQCIKQALLALDLNEIEIEVVQLLNNVRGKALNFYWQDKPFSDVKSPIIRACLGGDGVSLTALSELYLDKRLDPRVSGVALKILEHLHSPLFVEQKLSGPDALWLFCHTLALSAQLRKLDPKFISSTPLYRGVAAGVFSQSGFLSLDDRLWSNEIVRGLPIIEVSAEIAFDVLALAFIKAVASTFGPRGASIIIHIGIGLSKSGGSLLEASWCEASLPDTVFEVGLNNKPKCSALIEVTGLVAFGCDMPAIVSMLSLNRAMAI
ncbi:MAG TPA: hypothetical protein VEK06_03695, partial [Myxococcota bacterium]|nr:hypothetical protein [Myxococcota bacterium]